jgi:hypothetical protein
MIRIVGPLPKQVPVREPLLCQICRCARVSRGAGELPARRRSALLTRWACSERVISLHGPRNRFPVANESPGLPGGAEAVSGDRRRRSSEPGRVGGVETERAASQRSGQASGGRVHAVRFVGRHHISPESGNSRRSTGTAVSPEPPVDLAAAIKPRDKDAVTRLWGGTSLPSHGAQDSRVGTLNRGQELVKIMRLANVLAGT